VNRCFAKIGREIKSKIKGYLMLYQGRYQKVKRVRANTAEGMKINPMKR
jgi:hypothetical protein